MMRKLALAVLLFLPAAFSSFAQDSKELTVMSFNVRVWTRDKDESSPAFWKTRMEAMQKMIEDVNPDVICFQEFMSPVGRYVPASYRRVGVTVSHPIYVRRSLKTRSHKIEIFWESCTVDGIRFFNVHSRWEKEAIERTVRQINRHLTGCDIACGDWNNSLETIRNAGFDVPSAREILGLEETDTFANFKRPEQSHGAIDHFFVNGLTPVSYRMITDGYGAEKISDHYPIVLNIKY